jgi:hypothetical protein
MDGEIFGGHDQKHELETPNGGEQLDSFWLDILS